ncbi:Bud13 protein [Saccharomycopsis crataegensis]|uniref:Pre-mRNA-splicing factor CWC26 n=1 Tax=Saccharomycopsis crataegensis TaxID=43959 RepID=A0AAV5QQN7_9ASCO|nr:Bud13 protein [Saccharomycopsis crataegensis]
MAGLSDYLNKNYGSKKKSKSKKQSSKPATTVVVDKQGQNPGHADDAVPQPTLKEQKKSEQIKGWKVVGQSSEEQTTVRKDSGLKHGLQFLDNKGSNDEQHSEVDEDSIIPNNQETIYRNSKGQKIDIAEKLQQDSAAKTDEEARKRKLNEARNRSESQVLKKQRYDEDLKKIKDVKTAVYANDESLNQERKSQMFEDDPLLYISNTLNGEAPKSAVPSSKSGRKLFDKGPPPVNRFNITPGYRWDGVDRSNGFELKWFNRQYEVREKASLRSALQDSYE